MPVPIPSLVEPAVENQATDRTHRLGQTKAVFVYKLVVAGSTEEKIRDLQKRKADLAADFLAEDHEGTVKFGEDDIKALLAPLPEKGTEKESQAIEVGLQNPAWPTGARRNS